MPGCFADGDTIEDALKRAQEAMELYMECLLLDGDPIPKPKGIAFHENNPDYAGGHWKFVAVILPTDVSKKQDIHPGPIQRFFQWFSQNTQTLR